jgi:hypothetical protein
LRIRLAVFFIGYGFAGTIAEEPVLGKAARRGPSLAIARLFYGLREHFPWNN